ncbi:hypothetical protein I6E29_02880 [Arcanobacterium haemolyticum]|nr:hypothetical protein [Arcanobacterium haemolyticum]
MATDARTSLDRLIGALETFHQAAITAPDADAPSVLEASDALVDAYTLYDDALFTQYGVELPLDIYGADDDYDDDDDEDDDLDYDDLDDEDEDYDEDDDEDEDDLDFSE